MKIGIKIKTACFLAAAVLLMPGMGADVQAETFQGSSDWQVTFDGKKMNSNFGANDLASEVYQILPGDIAKIQVKLKNSGENGTDWYMANEILQSLEDSRESAGGGAYTYILTYVDSKGTETTLYNSEAVGGEGSAGGQEGLYQATGALDEYFFLDSLASGDAGTVYLTVGLDGETQGNSYQETLARLQMNFAVEEQDLAKISPNGAGSNPTLTPTNTPKVGDPLSGGSAAARKLPKTGDETDIFPYCAAAFVSGAVLLGMGLLLLKKRDEEEGVEA